MTARAPSQLQAIIDAALRGQLDQAAAERLHTFGPEAVGIVMLAVSKRIAELQAAAQPTPSTPSGMTPVYTKPNTRKRRKKPGAKKGRSEERRVGSGGVTLTPPKTPTPRVIVPR